MTSWIRVPPPLKKKDGVVGPAGTDDAEPVKPLFYATNDEDAPTQFLNFFYAHLYARSIGQPLAVYDRVNPVSVTTGLFKDTFYDISGVVYVDAQVPRATPIARRAAQITAHVRDLKRDDLADEAQLFFELNEAAGARVREFLKGNGFPREFDVGILFQPGDAIGVGERRGVYVQNYLAALRGFQAKAGLSALRVFLVSSDANFSFELKRLADPAWSIYSLPPTRVSMLVGSAPNQRMRQEAFTQTLAELVVLQNVPAVIGRISSSLGKILYLTREEPTSFLALEGGRFSAL
jgi:hypothetical protein